MIAYPASIMKITCKKGRAVVECAPAMIRHTPVPRGSDGRVRSLALVAALAAGSIVAVACGAAVQRPRPFGATLHLAKCGSCHARPEPGRFDEAGWATVLTRHRRRAPMSDADRSALLEFLGRRPGGGAGDGPVASGGAGGPASRSHQAP